MPPSDPDAYEVLDDGPEVEVRAKGSRFLGQAFHAGDESRAAERLDQVRKRYHDATHHCWASVLGDPEHVERYDDNGEPARTAGPPILNSLKRAGVTEALVVVTRYYGGTKLGTGGLMRAYGEAADAALEVASRRVLWRTRVLRVAFDYNDLGAVEGVVAKAGRAIQENTRVFDPSPEMILTVTQSQVDALGAALTEATAGRVRVEAS